MHACDHRNVQCASPLGVFRWHPSENYWSCATRAPLFSFSERAALVFLPSKPAWSNSRLCSFSEFRQGNRIPAFARRVFGPGLLLVCWQGRGDPGIGVHLKDAEQVPTRDTEHESV